MATTDSDDGGVLSSQPFAWILIPLVIFFFIGLIATIFQVRRRRRRRAMLYQRWPSSNAQRVFTPHGEVIIVRRRPGASRWTPWQRSQEGLNELGEAPPPYDGKKDPRQNGEGTELRDLEAGERPPPEYPAMPGPAVTTESRRG